MNPIMWYFSRTWTLLVYPPGLLFESTGSRNQGNQQQADTIAIFITHQLIAIHCE
jgi:hypothetical protein